ncbi:MAG: TonB family protein [Bacteroidota bacterium]|jgi:TonB family protein
MKPLLCTICVLFFSACSSTQQVSELVLPELLIQQPLPPFPASFVSPTVKIDLEILVIEDGSVKHVRLLSTSGNPEWDSTALLAIKNWRYSPAIYQGKPVRLWLHQTATVQFSQPHLVPLAEIICTTQEEADTAYARLAEGCEFCDMVLMYSISSSKQQRGSLGEVNIHLYPDHVERALEQLAENEFTKPIKFGDKYIIFKRIKEEHQEPIP